MTDKLKTVMPKIAPLLRLALGKGATDSERISAIHAVQRQLEGADSDSHELVERIENPPLNAGEMQRSYDKGFKDGDTRGFERGRRSVVIAAAPPIGVFAAASDVSTGVNGYSWLEIVQYCAYNKHRIFRDKDRKFIDSIFERVASQHRPPSSRQAKWLRDIFDQWFAGRIE